ncbi:MAG: DUF5320 domain-containing protein [Chloroflexi bacterium]|nr:DUF5320 domain-containing protein [Chloroflexota bacterium]MBL7061350.1 DUF5320 domain-containing protein [Dehalococcoidia bacterium]
MPGFDGTGPMGMGPMTGGGRGFCSPWGIRAGAQAYGIPRRRGYGYPYHAAGPFAPGVTPYAPQMSREQELGFLKQQAEAMRVELKEIEARIKELAKETK